MTGKSDHLRDLVANVAAAYFANTHVSPNDIDKVIGQIAGSLSAVGSSGSAAPQAAAASPASAAPPEKGALTLAQIRKSITHDALVSFENSKPYKALKRHLAALGLTPAQYREKWGLPKDYPMVAASYSATRSTLAKAMGLSPTSRKKATTPPAPAAAAAPAKRRGRPKKKV